MNGRQRGPGGVWHQRYVRGHTRLVVAYARSSLDKLRDVSCPDAVSLRFDVRARSKSPLIGIPRMAILPLTWDVTGVTDRSITFPIYAYDKYFK